MGFMIPVKYSHPDTVGIDISLNESYSRLMRSLIGLTILDDVLVGKVPYLFVDNLPNEPKVSDVVKENSIKTTIKVDIYRNINDNSRDFYFSHMNYGLVFNRNRHKFSIITKKRQDDFRSNHENTGEYEYFDAYIPVVSFNEIVTFKTPDNVIKDTTIPDCTSNIEIVKGKSDWLYENLLKEKENCDELFYTKRDDNVVEVLSFSY